MRRVMYVVGGAAWFLLVFLISFRLTFPSDVVADRIAYEVQQQSSGALALEVASVSPWWVGASAQDVRLFKIDAAQPDGVLAFAAESARVRVGLASLLRGAPRLTGALQVGSGELDFVVGTRMNQKGTALTVSELDIDAPGLPISDLAAIAGLTMDGSGAIDVDVELDASDTMRTATGKASITGSGLVISKLDLSSMGVPDLGLEIPVETIDLGMDIADGKATITRGILRSELATVEIEGDLVLRDDLERSTINVALLVGDLGASLAPFKGFLGDTWPDGKYHFRCSGTLARRSCRPEHQRSTVAGSRGSAISRPVAPSTPRADTPTSSAPSRTPPPMDDEERQRRRDELRERLRQRREERAAERPTEGGGDEDWEEEVPPPEGEDFPSEEEFFDDEVPLEEELGDEEF